MNDFQKALINILGKDAFFSTDFKVTDNVIMLCKAVHYMNIQLNVLKTIHPDEVESHINDVQKNVTDILNNKD